VTQLPSPLVPPEVSMGGNDWFPLYHRRLRKSRWWRIASDVARSRNVDLWCHAFEETPAGSLPDDDLELAEAAGFGRDITSFQALKAEIMAPWLLCADGRWYHPALCEVVLEAWERTSERRRKDRARQAAWRASQPRGAPLGVTRDDPALSRVTTPEVTHEGATQTDRQDRKDSVASASPLATVEGGKGSKPAQAEPWRDDPGFLAVWDGSTPMMRRRAKSMSKAWTEWVKVRKGLEPDRVLAGLRAYLKGDPDVNRTGGPGLHLWLRDRTFEQWVEANPAAGWTAERWGVAVDLWKASGDWGETLGPAPGLSGCRVPQAVLADHGLGLRVVQGGQR
jgi:hypothetical protein